MFSAILEESETQRFGNVVVRNENNLVFQRTLNISLLNLSPMSNFVFLTVCDISVSVSVFKLSDRCPEKNSLKMSNVQKIKEKRSVI